MRRTPSVLSSGRSRQPQLAARRWWIRRCAWPARELADIQSALIKGADQYVGQGHDRLRSDGARIHRCLEPVVKQAEAVAIGKVASGLPAEHNRAIQQQDPFDRWVGARLRKRRTPAHSAVIGRPGRRTPHRW
jgi:hypothetical protein